MDNKYPSIGLLSSCINSDTLTNVCDCKGDDDLQAYRLNEDKLIAWLKTKVNSIVDLYIIHKQPNSSSNLSQLNIIVILFASG